MNTIQASYVLSSALPNFTSSGQIVISTVEAAPGRLGYERLSRCVEHQDEYPTQPARNQHELQRDWGHINTNVAAFPPLMVGRYLDGCLQSKFKLSMFAPPSLT